MQIYDIFRTLKIFLNYYKNLTLHQNMVFNWLTTLVKMAKYVFLINLGYNALKRDHHRHSSTGL